MYTIKVKSASNTASVAGSIAVTFRGYHLAEIQTIREGFCNLFIIFFLHSAYLYFKNYF
jgi:stage V sporulation protein SpoVS